MRKFLKNYNCADTIAAIATFPAASALGVVKISGKKALNIAAAIFKPHKKKDIRHIKAYTMHYGSIINRHGKVVDEVIVSLMRAPNSYTREDVVEISSHGGVLMVNKILELVLKCGARLALPGEFTYRAFLNGRIGLAQAQAVADIVEAKSEAGLNLAVKQLRGENFDRLEKGKQELKELFSESEAYLNFPEEDIAFSFVKLTKKIDRLAKELGQLLNGAQKARLLKEGLRCVVCGRANVGKSTLFNRLLKEERVIVSRIAGTTRDVVEETIIVGGVPLKIFDTAGIITASDLLTKEAVTRSRSAIEAADIILLVVDGSRPANQDDQSLIARIKDKAVVTVVNKIDLRQKIDVKALPGKIVYLSALKNQGIPALEKAVYGLVYQKGVARHGLVFLSQYQSVILEEVIAHLARAKEFLLERVSFDMVNACLREALESFGRLTGEVECEEVLADIFGKFCIGK